MDLQTEQNDSAASQHDCHTSRRPLDKAHFKLEPIDINQTERAQYTSKMGRDTVNYHLQQKTVCGDNNDLTNDMTWLTAV